MTSRIAARIMSNLKQRGDTAMLSFGATQISASAFVSRIEDLQDKLAGLADHDTLALLLKTSPDALACFIASLSVVQNTAYFDINWSDRTVERMTQICGAGTVIADDDHPSFLSLSDLNGADFLRSGVSVETPQNGEPRFTCFTSGSTGLPKGCRRAEASWIRSFEADREFTAIDSTDMVIVPGSFAHSLFLYAAIKGLYENARVALFPAFSPRKIAEHLEAVPRAVIFGVPTQLDALAQAATHQINGVKRILSTGSKLPRHTVRSLRKTFPNASVVEFYGTSELSYVAARVVNDGDADTLVGTPLPGVELSIRDQSGEPVEPGHTGLVNVRSEMVFDGYVDGTGASSRTPFISVGDQGFVSERGDLHLQGRVDRVFQCSGRNIAPEAIEAALLSVKGIRLAAVAGLPDRARENRIVAVIALDQPIPRPDLVSALRRDLASYEIPHDYFRCDDWPKTTGGKTDLMKIRALLGNGELERLY